MKVDVAVQSYKKPESLLYALMSLVKYSGEHINNIFINDDSDWDIKQLESIFLNDKVKKYFEPHKIFLRKNTQRVGYWYRYVKKYFPRKTPYYNFLPSLLYSLYRHKNIFAKREDIRYQYAFDNTKSEYLYIIHDDMIFTGDIIGLYLQCLKEKEFDIIGDLGQCWGGCSLKETCTPEKILKDKENSSIVKEKEFYKSPCRINEWSCLVKVSTEQEIIKKHKIFFGNSDGGDIAVYWFKLLIHNNYTFTDPLINNSEKQKYYTHGWFGRSGHSVWEDQNDGKGKSSYEPQKIIKKTIEDFGISLI